jgi:hypothetical protein
MALAGRRHAEELSEGVAGHSSDRVETGSGDALAAMTNDEIRMTNQMPMTQ